MVARNHVDSALFAITTTRALIERLRPPRVVCGWSRAGEVLLTALTAPTLRDHLAAVQEPALNLIQGQNR